MPKHPLVLGLPILLLSLPALAGVPGPVLFQGHDTLGIRLSGEPEISGGRSRVPSFRATAELADDGDFTYRTRSGVGQGVVLSGRLEGGDAPTLTLDDDDLDALELTLAAYLPVLGLSGLGAVSSLFIDREAVATRVSRKEKEGEVTLGLQLRLSFEGINNQANFFRGTLQLKARLSSSPRCPVCGSTFTGVAATKASFKGCGSEKVEGPASLQIDAVAHGVGLADFVYIDGHGNALSGFLAQQGKRIRCGFDGGAAAAWAAIADGLCGELPGAVALSRVKCSAKLTRDGALQLSTSLAGGGDGAEGPIRGATAAKATLRN